MHTREHSQNMPLLKLKSNS